MSSQAQKLLEEILQLPDDDRSVIATRLLDSRGESREAVAAAWRQEVRQRLTEVKAGRVQLVPWEEARERIFAKTS